MISVSSLNSLIESIVICFLGFFSWCWYAFGYASSVSIEDIDSDGDLEIIAGISTVTPPDAGISTVYIEGGGGANVTTADTAPTSPEDGDLWWKSDVGALKVYYDDGDSQQWVDAAGTQGALSGSYMYDMYSLSGQTSANAFSDWLHDVCVCVFWSAGSSLGSSKI